MNLALEYLVRTKSIRNFFRTPSSLYLERGDDKIVVTFDGTVEGCYRLKRWHLSDCPIGHLLPYSISVLVPQGQIFDNRAVIPQGFQPIPYCQESVDTSLNSYKRPMSADIYEFFVGRMLCSEPHVEHKERWLWESFYYRFLPTQMRDRFPNKETMLRDSEGQAHHPWHAWGLWQSQLFPDRDNPAACELIFMS